MEGFNSYRDNLSKKLAGTPKAERSNVLSEARKTDEYQEARNEKLAQVQGEESIDDGLGILLTRKTLYHGSPVAGINTFTHAEDDTVGKGVYFTSEAKDAIGYARHRARGEETPTLYETHVEDVKLLDLRNDENVAKIMPAFANLLKKKLQEYRAQNTVSSGVWINILEGVIQRIEAGEIKVNTLKSATQQTGHWFSEYVSSLGYAGIATEEGGEGNIGNHDTYLIFDPEKIQIRKEQSLSKTFE